MARRVTPWNVLQWLVLAALFRFALVESSGGRSIFQREISNWLPRINTGRAGAQEEVIQEDVHDICEAPSNETSVDFTEVVQVRATKAMEDSKRQAFLDRIASASTALMKREKDAQLDQESHTENAKEVTPQSDLTRPGRHIHIVTTAALPWFTGTAVNPLLRAAYLHRRTREFNNGEGNWVTLVLPWLELKEDQQQLYHQVFSSPREQESHIREWLRNSADMPDAAKHLKIVWYPARYHSGLGSVFAMGDIISLLPEDELDVCLLEEPEHVNWYRAPGEGWTRRYKYVLGVVHTNYQQYAASTYSGLWTAPALSLISSAMIRAYCHKVIKLSDVLQTFAPEKEVTSNVHGVRRDFLEPMDRTEVYNTQEVGRSDKKAVQIYFIGKLLWAKGLDLLLELEEFTKDLTGEYFDIAIYGSGPDQKEITRAFLGRKTGRKKSSIRERGRKRLSIRKGISSLVRRRGKKAKIEAAESERVDPASNDISQSTKSGEVLDLVVDKAKSKIDQITDDLPKSFHELRRQPVPASFPGRVDHVKLKDGHHKIFINPSTSEVLCTTTAEALAMGKFAIIPIHPSNTFFLKFPNCLGYRNKLEFVANLKWALTHDPIPLTPEYSREFTWEAATDRLIEASAITHQEAWEREALGKSKTDERIAWFHNTLGRGKKGDVLRKVFGAGPASDQHKYEQERNGESSDEDLDDEEELTIKLKGSSFVKAIRQATANGIPSFR